jgi:hypothetical protein
MQQTPTYFDVSPLSILLIILPIVILAMHLILAVILRRRFAFPAVIGAVAALALFTGALWIIVALPMGWWQAFCCIGLPDFNFYNDLSAKTLFLPFNICYAFPGLRATFGDGFCQAASCWFLPTMLFLLGLVIVAIVPRRRNVADRTS